MSGRQKCSVLLLCICGITGSLGQDAVDPGIHSANVTQKPTAEDPPSDMASIAVKDASGKPVECNIWGRDNIHDVVQQMEDEQDINLFKFVFSFENYTSEPFRENIGYNYKPYLWYRTRSRHGRTLLMLSFHYDVLSMNILTIGVTELAVTLHDKPYGCFGDLDPEDKMTLLRRLLLSRASAAALSNFQSAREEYICNQVIEGDHGYAEFKHKCCMRQMQDIVCSVDNDDLWITILYCSITVVKVLIFLFCPNFVPVNSYSKVYLASEYVVKLKRDLRMKLFVSEKTDAKVRYKHRLTLEEISEWSRFRKFLKSLPYDETVPLKVSKLRIKVKGKRIIPENDPPTGLLRTFYDNVGRCKIKQLGACRDCCETSVYASMEPKCRHKCTWHMFVQVLIKAVLLLLVVPSPFYIRLVIYYNYEHEEMRLRRDAIASLDLGERFDLYRTNVIQYLSPLHGIFIATYCFYFFSGLVIGFSSYNVREKLKNVARAAMQDMNNVSQTSVLAVIMRFLLFPYRRFGLLAFLIAPFYGIIATPLCLFMFTVYCVPTVYLSHRLPFHARKLIGRNSIVEEERKLRFKKMQKLQRRISRVDRSVHKGGDEAQEDGCCYGDWSFSGLATVRDVVLQVACSIFCLCILYSLSLIFAESTGLIIEVLTFTMMGIIVNAGSVLKYVTMGLLVIVYMHDCYDNVYENYLTFNKTIIDEMIERTTDDLRRIASMPSNKQENTAFMVSCIDEEKSFEPKLNFKKKEIRWKVGQLLLFLDSNDTPRIPLRLFQKLCQIRVYGAPGPVYLNLLAATGKFMIIVVFLMFVMLVVMAFGNVVAMSSTNTTLATLAGGFVPMLLKNVLSSKGAKLSLKTISFKGQVDEIISDYKQYWPAFDFIAERIDPNEPEDDKKTEEEGGADGNGKDSENNNEKSRADRRDDHQAPSSKDKGFDLYVKKTVTKDAQVRKVNGDGERGEGKPGDDTTGKLADGAPPHEDNDVVDLFIDLGVADTAGGWSIHGSSDSLPSASFDIMPPYFDPSQVNEEDPDDLALKNMV